VNTFEFYRFRFHFRAIGTVHLPAGKGANLVRGVFGAALRETAGAAEYRRLFEPGAGLRETAGAAEDRRLSEPGAAGGKSPSGLADWPRPFVFRAAHLEGATIPPGDSFFVDVHVFHAAAPALGLWRRAFARLAENGIGPGRGRAVLERVEQLDPEDRGWTVGDAAGAPSVVALSQLPADRPGGLSYCRVRFATPTELKWEGHTVARPEFGILFARLRDRIATLRALYGAGPLEMDFAGSGERAARVRLAHSDLHYQSAERRSRRTGQAHPLGGFTGDAEYQGELAEFLPWLRAARWVGVGRQTVWGKGDLRVIP
jgi:hypothetical protein